MSKATPTKLTAIGSDLLERFKIVSSEEREEIMKNIELDKHIGLLKEKGVQGLLAKAGAGLGQGKKVLGEQGFWSAWLAKLLFTLISVKFWGLVCSLGITTWLLTNQLIEPSHWVIFNSTVWGVIFGLKGIYRIREGRDEAEQKIIEMMKDR